jgi:hypothetical protein
VLTGGDAGKAWTKVYRVDAFPGNMTEVYGININDDVVGSTAKEDPVTGQPDLTNVDSFMQTDAVNLPSTQLSNFPAPAYFSRAWGITDAQKIVGDCNFEGAPDNHYGFVRDQTASPLLDYIEMFTPVGTGSLWSGEFTAANSTFAQGINQLSTLIIGQFTDNHGDIHGFVLSWIVWSAWRLWINQRFPPQRMTTKI